MESGITIVVDKRERNAELIAELERLCSIRFEIMPSGDYLISENICVERKTVRDFESSIINGRLFEQISALREDYQRPILLIEGDESDSSLYHGSVYGAIVSAYIRYGVQVVRSRGPKESAELLYIMARQESDGSTREISPKRGRRARSDDAFIEYIVGNIPGVGIMLARSLLKEFGSVRAIANANIEDIMRVDGIGRKRAQRVYEIMHREYSGDHS